VKAVAILRPMVIALEGLPGVGKTTLAPMLGGHLEAQVLRETTANHPFLAQVYEDDSRDDLTVELAFLLVHANPYRQLDRQKLTVCDYSPAKDILFAKDMLRGRDLRVFEATYAHLYEHHPLPDVVVYLRAAPELCLHRARERMRKDKRRAFEAGLTLERLERMRLHYEADVSALGNSVLVYDVLDGPGEQQVATELAELVRPHAGRHPEAVAPT
jgi:deoxyguanosine kinase